MTQYIQGVYIDPLSGAVYDAYELKNKCHRLTRALQEYGDQATRMRLEKITKGGGAHTIDGTVKGLFAHYIMRQSVTPELVEYNRKKHGDISQAQFEAQYVALRPYTPDDEPKKYDSVVYSPIKNRVLYKARVGLIMPVASDGDYTVGFKYHAGQVMPFSCFTDGMSDYHNILRPAFSAERKMLNK